MKIDFLCYSCGDITGNPKQVSEKAINLRQAILKHEKKYNHDTLPTPKDLPGIIIKKGILRV